MLFHLDMRHCDMHTRAYHRGLNMSISIGRHPKLNRSKRRTYNNRSESISYMRCFSSSNIDGANSSFLSYKQIWQINVSIFDVLIQLISFINISLVRMSPFYYPFFPILLNYKTFYAATLRYCNPPYIRRIDFFLPMGTKAFFYPFLCILNTCPLLYVLSHFPCVPTSILPK